MEIQYMQSLQFEKKCPDVPEETKVAKHENQNPSVNEELQMDKRQQEKVISLFNNFNKAGRSAGEFNRELL